MPTGRAGWIGDAGLALLTFAVLVLIVLSGFLPFAMVMGVPMAGVIETGQAVPMRWWPGVLAGLVVLAIAFRRWTIRDRLWWLAVAGTGAALMIALLCFVAGRGGPWSGAAHPAAERTDAGVVTALPLFWSEEPVRDLDRGASADRRAFARASRHRLVPIDHVDDAALARFERMLLAQPRALAPAELVALDRWVRAGGRMVVLADPLLLWPSGYPLGDRRRPPLTSLLDPLLAHWGVRLEPATLSGEQIERHMLSSGPVLILAGASRFVKAGGSCALEERGLLAACRIGRGQVRIVADADLIDDRLWLVDAGHPDAAAAYAADSVAVIDQWLDTPLAIAAPHIRRIRDEAALRNGMRVALAAGILWVGMGFALKRAGKRRVRRGK